MDAPRRDSRPCPRGAHGGGREGSRLPVETFRTGGTVPAVHRRSGTVSARKLRIRRAVPASRTRLPRPTRVARARGVRDRIPCGLPPSAARIPRPSFSSPDPRLIRVVCCRSPPSSSPQVVRSYGTNGLVRSTSAAAVRAYRTERPVRWALTGPASRSASTPCASAPTPSAASGAAARRCWSGCASCSPTRSPRAAWRTSSRTGLSRTRPPRTPVRRTSVRPATPCCARPSPTGAPGGPRLPARRRGNRHHRHVTCVHGLCGPARRTGAAVPVRRGVSVAGCERPVASRTYSSRPADRWPPGRRWPRRSRPGRPR